MKSANPVRERPPEGADRWSTLARWLLLVSVGVMTSCRSPITTDNSAPQILAVFAGSLPGDPYHFRGGSIFVLGMRGSPMQDATVSVNGQTLSYNSSYGDFESGVELPTGAVLDISVKTASGAYSVQET